MPPLFLKLPEFRIQDKGPCFFSPSLRISSALHDAVPPPRAILMPSIPPACLARRSPPLPKYKAKGPDLLKLFVGTSDAAMLQLPLFPLFPLVLQIWKEYPLFPLMD